MRTRLAPSPTGALHLGNARTFLLTWLHARAAGGSVVLRVDDLDGPRVRPGADAQAVEDLRWLGLDWDDDQPVLRQTERTAVYAAAAQDLLTRGLAYPCVCSRKEVERAASAPHGSDGPRYPGTCVGRFVDLADARAQSGRDAAVRFTARPGAVHFHDLLQGAQSFDPAAECGDFPVVKRNGTVAYQLATVLDDAAAGVDLVIRGDDLLPSTARQILLQEALGLSRPQYLHLPLVVGADGRRLAKRHGDTTLRHLREAGWTAARTVGWLAATADLAGPGEEATPADLLPRYEPMRLSRDAIVVDPAHFLPGVGDG